MGFPVLRLPSLVFDNVYQSLDVPDKIVFSQCSRRVRDLVSSREGPRTGRQVTIDFHDGCTAVGVIRRISDFTSDNLFTLKFYPVRDHESTDEKSFFNLNVDGISLDIKKCPPSMEGDWYCVPEEGSHEKTVLIIVKMLRNLFNCSINKIFYTLKNGNFQKFFVETDTLHRADKIRIHEGEFDTKDMDFMFDHFVSDYLDFWGYCGPEYSYQKALNSSKIHLAHAKWVNLENVFEMTNISKHVALCGAKLIGDKDINQFIKWWLTSDTKTLEFLTITRGRHSSSQPSDIELRMNRSVIMEGIESTPGKKKREEVTKYMSYIEWENGVDIIRKDGVQATLFVDHQTAYDDFLFAAWHHPNPNVEKVTDN